MRLIENIWKERDENYAEVKRAAVKPGKYLRDLMIWANKRDICDYDASTSNCHFYAFDIWNKIGKYNPIIIKIFSYH